MAWRGPKPDPPWMEGLRDKIKVVEVKRREAPDANASEFYEIRTSKRSRLVKRLWQDPECVLKVKNGHARANARPEVIERRRAASQALGMDPDWRRANSEAQKGRPW